MTFDQAIELVQDWPKNRTVPRKLKAGIEAATGLDKVFMEQLVEALMVASTTEADLELIEKHFD